MLTVRIHEGEARGRGQLLFDNCDVSMDTWKRIIVGILSAILASGARLLMGTIFLSYSPGEITFAS